MCRSRLATNYLPRSGLVQYHQYGRVQNPPVNLALLYFICKRSANFKNSQLILERECHLDG